MCWGGEPQARLTVRHDSVSADERLFRLAKPGLLPAAAMTGTGDNDTSVQSQPPNGDHAMRAADRDPAGGERPMELTAISRLMISSKRGSRKNSLMNKNNGFLPFLPIRALYTYCHFFTPVQKNIILIYPLLLYFENEGNHLLLLYRFQFQG